MFSLYFCKRSPIPFLLPNPPVAAGKIFGAERAPHNHARRTRGDLGNSCWGWAPSPRVVKGEMRAPRQELLVVMGCHTIFLCQGPPVLEVCGEGLKPGPSLGCVPRDPPCLASPLLPAPSSVGVPMPAWGRGAHLAIAVHGHDALPWQRLDVRHLGEPRS